VLAAVEALTGSWAVSLPAAHGAVTVPFRRELPIATAALIAGSLNSAMRSLAETGARTLRRFELVHLLAVAVVGIVLTGITEWAMSSPSEAWLAIRALLIWAGLAVVSGRVLGWLMSWLLPVATVFPLIYYGQDSVGDDGWWNWTAKPAEYAPCWLLAATSVVVAAGAVALTPWRLHAIRRKATGRPADGRRAMSRRGTGG
jgi:hypothetical protein